MATRVGDGQSVYTDLHAILGPLHPAASQHREDLPAQADAEVGTSRSSASASRVRTAGSRGVATS